MSLAYHLSTDWMTPIQKTFHKAIFDDGLAPKEKHVANMIRLIQRDDQYNLFMWFRIACKPSLGWSKLLKIMVVLHRITRDGSDKFMQDFAANNYLTNNLTWFDDNSNSHTKRASNFIVCYAHYLTEKAYVYHCLHYSIEQNELEQVNKWTTTLTLSEIIQAFPRLARQLSLLLDCMGYSKAPRLVSVACILLAKDAYALHTTLYALYLALLEKLSELTAETAVTVLKEARQFINLTNQMQAWSANLNSCQITDMVVPTLKDLPPSYFALLEDRKNKLKTLEALPPVEKLELDDSPVNRKVKKEKKEKKKKDRKKSVRIRGEDLKDQNEDQFRRNTQHKPKSRAKAASIENSSSDALASTKADGNSNSSVNFGFDEDPFAAFGSVKNGTSGDFSNRKVDAFGSDFFDNSTDRPKKGSKSKTSKRGKKSQSSQKFTLQPPPEDTKTTTPSRKTVSSSNDLDSRCNRTINTPWGSSQLNSTNVLPFSSNIPTPSQSNNPFAAGVNSDESKNQPGLSNNNAPNPFDFMNDFISTDTNIKTSAHTNTNVFLPTANHSAPTATSSSSGANSNGVDLFDSMMMTPATRFPSSGCGDTSAPAFQAASNPFDQLLQQSQVKADQIKQSRPTYQPFQQQPFQQHPFQQQQQFNPFGPSPSMQQQSQQQFNSNNPFHLGCVQQSANQTFNNQLNNPFF